MFEKSMKVMPKKVMIPSYKDEPCWLKDFSKKITEMRTQTAKTLSEFKLAVSKIDELRQETENGKK